MSDKKKHILVISQYFYPETFRINDICAELVERGYDVTVVTGIPNYPQGKFFAGYGYFKKRKEVYRGVDVIRLPLIPRGKSGLQMVLNYISFAVVGLLWACFTSVKAEHVFIFQLSPATLALPGVWYARRRKLKCSMYVQDLWPESVTEITGISNRHVMRMLGCMMSYIYDRCDTIFATSPSFVEVITKRCNQSAKVRYLPQYAEEYYEPHDKVTMQDLEISDTFRVVFTGNIGVAQGLSILPETAVLLKREGIRCEFVLVGEGRSRIELEERIRMYEVEEMFVFLGSKAPEQVPGYLALCDLAFLSFKRSELFSMTIPAKLQSYMACCMPILAVADGETSRIIKEANCGLVSDFDKPDMLARCIKQCMAGEYDLLQMGKNAGEYSRRHFDKKQIMDILESAYDDVE